MFPRLLLRTPSITACCSSAGTYFAHTANVNEYACTPVCVEATRCFLLHSNDVVLREVPEAIARLVSVSVCYRAGGEGCCGAWLRDRQPRIKLMYELRTRDTVWLMASLYGVRSRGKPRENSHLLPPRTRCFSPVDELSIIDKRLRHEGD